MDFFAVSFVVDIHDVEMHSFCLRTSIELNLTPNCSFLYLHSNDINSLKSLLLGKKSDSYKYNCNKTPQ